MYRAFGNRSTAGFSQYDTAVFNQLIIQSAGTGFTYVDASGAVLFSIDGQGDVTSAGTVTAAPAVGTQNTIVGGVSAGALLASGASNNTIGGFSAGAALTAEANNTLIGSQAGALLQGDNNTFVGAGAGLNATASSNIVIGHACGQSLSAGLRNTIMGTSADVSAAAADTVIIGSASASTSNQTTLVGADSTVRGLNSVVVGFDAATNADNTVVVGAFARATNFSGGTTIIGTSSTSDGTDNTVLGVQCVASSFSSVAVGAAVVVSGQTTIAIGASSNASFDNSAALGFGTISRAANVTTICNAACVSVEPMSDNVASLGSGANRWSDVFAVSGVVNVSDRRDKCAIHPSSLGLSFVRELQPVQYEWKDGPNVKKQFFGLIAQDVESVLRDRGLSASDFAGLVRHSESKTAGNAAAGNAAAGVTYGLRYTEFIAPIISAIQELDKKIDKLQEIHASLALMAMRAAEEQASAVAEVSCA